MPAAAAWPVPARIRVQPSTSVVVQRHRSSRLHAMNLLAVFLWPVTGFLAIAWFITFCLWRLTGMITDKRTRGAGLTWLVVGVVVFCAYGLAVHALLSRH